MKYVKNMKMCFKMEEILDFNFFKTFSTYDHGLAVFLQKWGKKISKIDWEHINRILFYTKLVA